MKETIYSIPINEAFDSTGDGCPVCALHTRLTDDNIEYALGAAMMEPDVRERMNTQGFCPGHLESLSKRQKKLPLALVLQTHIDELRKNPKLLAQPAPCYICKRIDGFLQSYYANILYLWNSEPEFKAKWDRTKYICLKHTAGLLTAAPRDLNKKNAAAFSDSLAKKATEALLPVSESLGIFIKSFDHRYSGQELGEHRQATSRAINCLGGNVE